jgi:hypothetical protein
LSLNQDFLANAAPGYDLHVGVGAEIWRKPVMYTFEAAAVEKSIITPQHLGTLEPLVALPVYRLPL